MMIDCQFLKLVVSIAEVFLNDNLLKTYRLVGCHYCIGDTTSINLIDQPSDAVQLEA